MTLNEVRDFTFENYYKRIRFVTESTYYSMKRLRRKHFLLIAINVIEERAVPSREKSQNQ